MALAPITRGPFPCSASRNRRDLLTPVYSRLAPPPGPPFAPTDVAGLSLWLKADAITGLNDADLVTTWNDSSGNGYNATQATSGSKPAYKTNIVNGLPVVRFVDDFLSTGVAISSLITNSAYTIFVVAKPTAISTNSANAYYNDPIICDSGGNMGMHLKSNSGSPMLQAYNWDGSEDKAETSCVVGAFQFFMQRHESGNLYVQRNGDAEVSTPSGNTNDMVGVLRLGYSSASYNQAFEGDIAEIIIYNIALSSENRNLVKNYLASKYGITL